MVDGVVFIFLYPNMQANMAALTPNSEAMSQEIDQELLELLAKKVALQLDSPNEPRTRIQQLDWLKNAGLEAPLSNHMEMVADWLQHFQSLALEFAGRDTTIAYLGPQYSYSYLATVKEFGLAAALTPVKSIAAAFEEVARRQSRFAVVPIENSTDGRIVDTLGMFAKSSVKVCGEVLLPIHHCLLGTCSRDQIAEVHSKPQALSQCRDWLSEHLPDAKLVEVGSTAAAAALAAKQDGVAAIASEEAGVHQGLKVIARNIEDNTQNVTRFAVIGNEEVDPTGADKTSLMFQLNHEAGALATAMVIFQEAEVNLTWIESFPLPQAPNEYLFFVELEGHVAEPKVASAIANLKIKSRELDVLGSYPRASRGG